jgi:hypothetical protein
MKSCSNRSSLRYLYRNKSYHCSYQWVNCKQYKQTVSHKSRIDFKPFRHLFSSTGDCGISTIGLLIHPKRHCELSLPKWWFYMHMIKFSVNKRRNSIYMAMFQPVDNTLIQLLKPHLRVPYSKLASILNLVLIGVPHKCPSILWTTEKWYNIVSTITKWSYLSNKNQNRRRPPLSEEAPIQKTKSVCFWKDTHKFWQRGIWAI